MKIFITSGKGEATTVLSAFDKALYDAGIANYNLIKLSSIIPDGSKIKIIKPHNNEIEYGHKLYVVIARKDQETFGKEAWAGIGWVQAKNGKGMFVEHAAENKDDVLRLIKHSLRDMTKYRKGNFGKIDYAITGIECKNKPVCAVVVAVYQSEKW